MLQNSKMKKKQYRLDTGNRQVYLYQHEQQECPSLSGSQPQRKSSQPLCPTKVVWDKFCEDNKTEHQDAARQMKIWSKRLEFSFIHIESQVLPAAKPLEASIAHENKLSPSLVLCIYLLRLLQLLIPRDINLQSKQRYLNIYKNILYIFIYIFSFCLSLSIYININFYLKQYIL